MKHWKSYHYLVVTLFFFAPSLCLLAQWFIQPNFFLWKEALKWWVFFSIGIRLGSAGLKQSLQPRFTAEKIFAIQDPVVWPLVQEIGLANLALGISGILSFPFDTFRIPIAVCGALYLGFAGLLHLKRKHRNSTENFAMITDLSIALWLAILIFVNS